MTDRSPVRSYSSDFPLDESPISEGGHVAQRQNGRHRLVRRGDTRTGWSTAALSRMEVAEQRAEQGNLEDEEDAPGRRLRRPDRGAGRRVGAGTSTGRASSTARTRPTSTSRRCRSGSAARSSPNSCTGYEVFFRCLKTDEGYAEIVRWNGRDRGLDLARTPCRRRVRGRARRRRSRRRSKADVIKGFINGREVITVTRRRPQRRRPRGGFNFGVGDTGPDHGFSSLRGRHLRPPSEERGTVLVRPPLFGSNSPDSPGMMTR